MQIFKAEIAYFGFFFRLNNTIMFKVFKIVTTLLFVFFVFYAKSQKIEISFIDEEDSKPIPYVHICTENLSSGEKKYQTSDYKGNTIINSPQGTIISLSYLGFKTVVDTITSVVAKKVYKMEKTGFDLDEVVITGESKPLTSDNSIYNIKLLDKKLIEQKGATNLAELLSNELNIRLNHDPSTGTSLKMQGISGENVKILIDGIPVIGRLEGNIDLSQIDLSVVDHIEIVEGPMSVIYGSNALAGVINIITKDNKYARYKFAFNTYYESVGTYNANADVSLKLKKNILILNGGRNFFSGFDLNKTSRSAEYKPKEQVNGGFKYLFKINDVNLKYKADWFKERLLNRSDIFGYPYSARGLDTWYYTIRANNSIQLNHTISGRSSYNFLVGYSYYNRSRLNYIKDLTTLESVLSSEIDDHDTTIFNAGVSRSVYNFSSDNNKFHFQTGFDINLEKGLGKRIKNHEDNIQDYAVFSGFKWNVISGLTLQPGLRGAYNTKYKAPLVPSFNIMYKIKNVNIRASYARGFRAPSLKELYLNFFDINHQIEGNEDLKAEYSHNYNVSAAYKISKQNNKFRINLKGFYNIIENRITLVQVNPDNELYYRNENIGHFESVGFEVRANYKFLPYVSFDAGFARTGNTDIYNEKTLLFNNSVNSNLNINFLKNTAAVSIFYKYVGKYPYYTDFDELKLNILDAYNNLDITISKNFKHKLITVSSGIKNILNNTQIPGAAVGTGHGTGSGESSLVGWGRTFFVSFKINITKY